MHNSQGSLDRGGSPVGLLNAPAIRAALAGIAHCAARQAHRSQLADKVIMDQLGHAREDGLEVVLRDKQGTRKVSEDAATVTGHAQQQAWSWQTRWPQGGDSMVRYGQAHNACKALQACWLGA